MSQMNKMTADRDVAANDPLQWVVEDDFGDASGPATPSRPAAAVTPIKAKAETDELGTLNGLDAFAGFELLSSPIVVADEKFVVRYVNTATTKMFKKVEQDLRKVIPNFDVNNIVGQSLEAFHRNVSRKKTIMTDMQESHEGTMAAEGVSIDVRVKRINLGSKLEQAYLVEFTDISFQEHTKNQVAGLMAELDRLVATQLEGNMNEAVRESCLEDGYRDLATKLNHLIQFRNSATDEVILWLKAFASGETRKPVPEFPGQMAEVTAILSGAQETAIAREAAAESTRAEVERLMQDLAEMSDEHGRGKIGSKINVDSYDGALKVVAQKVNEMVFAHISTKKMVIDQVTAFSVGNFALPFPKLPLEKAFVSVAVEALRKTFKDLFGEITRVSAALCEGNLNVQANAKEFSGDYGLIMSNFSELIERLNQTFSTINREVLDSAMAVEQMSSAAQELALNSTSQSASVDEVSASAEETDTQVKANAAAAGQASQLVTSAATVAEEGKEKIGQMVQAMESIRASSQDIAKIIKVIDEIAFQTNLLALNAAVEAARAGQHGRGFAVVAQEVRNLAGRSAKAARETSELIESSGARVHAGVKIADEASRAFASISGDIDQVRAFMREIAVASDEQARGVAQINSAISEVAKTALVTSQQADEVEARVAQLEQATSRMKNEVSRFRLRENQAPVALPSLDSLPPELVAQIMALTSKASVPPANPANPANTKRNADRDERGFSGF